MNDVIVIMIVGIFLGAVLAILVTMGGYHDEEDNL